MGKTYTDTAKEWKRNGRKNRHFIEIPEKQTESPNL